MADIALLLVLGCVAGSLTTIAGLGGGMLLLLALSVLRDPASALAATAPALLLGNLHRFYLFRKDVVWRVAGPFGLLALPGAFVGGAFVVSIPQRAIHVLMVALTALALFRAYRSWRGSTSPEVSHPMKRYQLAGAGFGIGALTGTAGGAGLLVGPLFLASGLTATAYTASVSLVSALMHLGRLLGYGTGGLLTVATLRDAGTLALAILVGNLLGQRFRRGLDESVTRIIEYATLVLCVTLSLVGL